MENPEVTSKEKGKSALQKDSDSVRYRCMQNDTIAPNETDSIRQQSEQCQEDIAVSRYPISTQYCLNIV